MYNYHLSTIDQLNAEMNAADLDNMIGAMSVNTEILVDAQIPNEVELAMILAFDDNPVGYWIQTETDF